MKLIYICTVLFTVWLPMQGQSLQVQGSRIDLPPGDVLGAAFYENKGMFFVQQTIRSTERGGQVFSSRHLSSWDIDTHLMLSERSIDKIPRSLLKYPCGRLQVSPTSHRIYMCSAESRLEIVDPDSLEIVGAMAQVEGQTIIDFAVDDPHSRVLVLSARQDGAILLTSYALQEGDRQQETVLPVTSSAPVLPSDLLAVSLSGQIALLLGDSGKFKSNRGVYRCESNPALVCTRIAYYADANLPSEISFLGQSLLVATSAFADSSGYCCILAFDFSHEDSVKSPSKLADLYRYYSHNGVHYAVGVVDDRYVVGFTGKGRWNPFTETITSVSSTFSVWRAGAFKAAAVIKDSTDYGSSQDALRIVASTTNPLFMTYHGLLNTLFLYRITDH